LGRPGYSGGAMLKIFMVKAAKGIKCFTGLHQYLQEHQGLTHSIFHSSKIPSLATISRYYEKIPEDLLNQLLLEIPRKFFQENNSIFEDIVMDGVDTATFGNKAKKTDSEASWLIKNTAPPCYGYRTICMVSTRTHFILGSYTHGRLIAEDKMAIK